MRENGDDSRAQIPGFHLVMAVWGRAFTDLFLEVSLPNMLGPGNVAAVGDMPASRYRIFTSAEDAPRIEASPHYRRLCEVIRADVTPLEGLVGGERRIISMTSCHSRAILDANAENAALVFLSPDSVVSEGALAAIRRLAEQGAHAVMAVGLRLQLETFVPAFLEHARASGTMALPSRELVRLALDHLHPISRSMFVDNPEFNRTPAAFCWPVDGEGILVRSFHLHPLMVWPSRKDVVPISSVDGDYIGRACPEFDRFHVVTDSDELVAFEFSGADKIKGLVGRRPLSPVWAAAWATRHTSDHHRRFLRERIRIHAAATPASWRAVERRSDRMVRLVSALLAAGPWLSQSLYSVSATRSSLRKRYQRSVVKPLRRRQKRLRKLRARSAKSASRRKRARAGD